MPTDFRFGNPRIFWLVISPFVCLSKYFLPCCHLAHCYFAPWTRSSPIIIYITSNVTFYITYLDSFTLVYLLLVIPFHTQSIYKGWWIVLWKTRVSANSTQVLESHTINILMGLGLSDLVFVGHIFAFLSGRYTFSSQAQILKCQSRHLSKSRIYHSPPLLYHHIYMYHLQCHHLLVYIQLFSIYMYTCRSVNDSYIPSESYTNWYHLLPALT